MSGMRMQTYLRFSHLRWKPGVSLMTNFTSELDDAKPVITTLLEGRRCVITNYSLAEAAYVANGIITQMVRGARN